jgi:hypothetical protein
MIVQTLVLLSSIGGVTNRFRKISTHSALPIRNAYGPKMCSRSGSGTNRGSQSVDRDDAART